MVGRGGRYATLFVILGIAGLVFGWFAGRAATQSGTEVHTALPARHADVVFEDTSRLSALKVMPEDAGKKGAPTSGRRGIALILDDMGYSLEAARKVLSLPYPVALSIIPGSPYARKVAEMAHRHGFVVMLHLPMEPRNKWLVRHMDPTFLRSGMQKQDLQRTMLADLDAVPFVVGVNNHMGSRLTSIQSPMRWVMDICRDRGLFFVDSRTTRRSVAARMAQRAGLRWGERRVFLDDSTASEAIESSWRLAKELLTRRGAVIVIAHPHPQTLDFLAHRVRAEDVRRIVPLEYALSSTRSSKFASRRSPILQ